ncbi:MAG: 2-oxoacid:acceptor oxidoreductase family protein [Candidatus Rokubacteria bacterium]|nr:2-oxoacid:acceptor oxidoreductase family protein [Candidatus Rokubacteria bacterium]
MRTEVRFAGDGGQGLVLAGIVLAEAAGVYGGHYASQSQFYAPVIMGGPSYADVVISDSDTAFPWGTSPNVLVALTQRSFDHFANRVADDGLVLTDPSLVPERGIRADRVVPIPAREIAERAGAAKAANMVCVAAVAALTGVATLEHVQKAIDARVPGRLLDANRAAAKQGWDYAQKVLCGREA